MKKIIHDLIVSARHANVQLERAATEGELDGSGAVSNSQWKLFAKPADF